jgi:transposase
MKSISKDIENQIIQHLNAGESHRKIAQIVGVGRSTVQRVANRMFPGRTIEKNGRPPKLTERDKLYCVRQMTLGRKKTAVEVVRCLEQELGISVSVNTARNALKEKGLGSFVKPKKPYLSNKNVKDRLAWAKAHADWTPDDWKRVVWTDETKIDRFGADGRKYGWKRDREPLQSHHVQQTVKHGGGNIKLWSCIMYEGVGYIVWIKENLNQKIYLDILQDDFGKTIEEYGLDLEKMIFQQDNDPKHTARSVKEWLAKQPFEVMHWPAQSPDLNPIENMWAMLKLRLYRDYDCPPKGMNEHWERIAETWYKITKEECQKVIGTMPERCHQVIKAEGHWIDF